MLAPVGILLAGALCLAWSSTASGRRRRRRLPLAEALWAVSGLLAVSVVVPEAAYLWAAQLSTPAIGNSAATIFVGSVYVAAVVAFLGHVGVWASLRRCLPRTEAVARAHHGRPVD